MLTIKYWLKLNDVSNPSHCNKLFFLSLKDTERVPNNMYMKTILEILGFGHLWENKTTFFLRRTMTSPKSKLSERYMSYFKSVINEETKVKGRYITKLRTYKLFKTAFKTENYRSLPLDKQSLFSFSRFRVSNHKLKIKLRRYKNIPPEERYCRLRNLNQVQDEFHFIMSCSVYSEHREQLFQQIKDFVPSFDILPLSEKFIFLMGADDPEILTPFIKFVKKCSDVRKDMFTKMHSASH